MVKNKEISSLLERAKIAKDNFEFETAKEYLAKILSIQAEHQMALTEMRKVYIKECKYVEGIQFFKTFLEDEPENHYALLQLGILYREVGDYKKSKKLLEKVKEVYSDDIKTICELGLVYNNIGNKEKVNGSFKDLIKFFKKEIQETKKNQERTQMELANIAKLSVANAMSSSLAHQINNPLGNIGFNLYLLRRTDFSNKEEISACLDSMERSVGAIRNLTGHLNTVMKKEQDSKKAIYIEEVIESALRLFDKQLITQNIKIEKQNFIKDKNYRIYASFIKLEQVFMNLIANARDALKDCHKRLIRIQLDFAREDFLVIYFSDNGTGIPEEDRGKIFNTLFSTKPNGTGLGLWLCYAVLQELNGTIRIQSKLNVGTTFCISIPTLKNKKDE